MPSWYRRVDIRTEGDLKFRALSPPPPCGQFLWYRLMTGAHTLSLPGLSVAGEAQLAESCGWSVEGFREAFQEVLSEGLAKADWKARVVWLPNAIRYNPPESPNVVKSWGKIFDMIPECALKDEAHAQLKAFIEGMGQGFAKAFTEAFGKGYAESLSPSPSPSLSLSPRGEGEASRRRATPRQQGDVPPPAASQGEGEAAAPEPTRRATSRVATREQLDMLAAMAAERGLALGDAAREAGVPKPIPASQVTKLKDWLKSHQPPPPRMSQGCTIPDSEPPSYSPEERALAEQHAAAARARLERMARLPADGSAGIAAGAVPPPPPVEEVAEC